MSISTCSYCSAAYSSDVRQASPLNQIGWAAELSGRILHYGSSPDDFIDGLMPCKTPFTRDDDLTDAFSTYRPALGNEVVQTPVVVSGFNALVRSFPDSKRPQIEDTHGKKLNFPFDTFQNHHHPTYPDISVSFPGKALYRAWQSISMVIECKSDDSLDPFPKRGEKHKATVEQLAKNARNILLTHGALAAFVVGVYGNTVRLARFDHTCALVSTSFDIRTEAGKKTLQRFLWHFVHPVVGSTVVGSDPTVVPLTPRDREWVKKELEKARAKNWQDHMGEIHKGRRVEVYDEKTGRCVPYLLYHLVDVNARLFSRATMVWRAIEDRRIWKNGKLVLDVSRTDPVKPQIVKEAWRQLVRTAEAKFYQRLSDRIKDSERVGLAKMVYGGDLGEFELRWWNESVRRQEAGETATAAAEDAPSSGPSTCRPSSQLFCSTGSISSPLVSSVESPADYVPSGNYPLRHPQHQTYSWRLVFGKHQWHRERSHMRMVIDDVGRPLTEFTSTYELVLAIHDAIKGHQQAWTQAQLLHRDISVGNILIADEHKTIGEQDEEQEGVQDEEQDWKDEEQDGKDDRKAVSTGFLHDYDYSSMEPDPKEVVRTDNCATSSDDPTVESDNPDDGANQKERTGTFYFMAYEILTVPGIIHDTHHDLESFYWVLLWVVVRHTDHGHPVGAELCNKIFKYGSDEDSAGAKIVWLMNPLGFAIKDNEPLTYLFEQLRQLVRNNALSVQINGLPKLTYDALLEVFTTALHMPGWPEDDWRECQLLGKSDGRTGIAPIMSMGVEDQHDIPNAAPVQLPRPSRTEGPQRQDPGQVPPQPSHRDRHAPRTVGDVELFLQDTKKRSSPPVAEGSSDRSDFGGKDEQKAQPRSSKRLRTDSMGPPASPAVPRPAVRSRPSSASKRRLPSRPPTRSSARQEALRKAAMTKP